MKIERYSITVLDNTDMWWDAVPDLEGNMCYYSQVKQLEAQNAELVEALKFIMDDSFSYLRRVAFEKALVAIAKAEGGRSHG